MGETAVQELVRVEMGRRIQNISVYMALLNRGIQTCTVLIRATCTSR